VVYVANVHYSFQVENGTLPTGTNPLTENLQSGGVSWTLRSNRKELILQQPPSKDLERTSRNSSTRLGMRVWEWTSRSAASGSLTILPRRRLSPVRTVIKCTDTSITSGDISTSNAANSPSCSAPSAIIGSNISVHCRSTWTGSIPPWCLACL